MTWSINQSGGDILKTSGGNIARCQPCSAYELQCAIYESMTPCLPVDICGLSLCKPCMTLPTCSVRTTRAYQNKFFNHFPDLFRPASMTGILGRHQLVFAQGLVNQSFCRSSARLEGASLLVDGWDAKVEAVTGGHDITFACDVPELAWPQPSPRFYKYSTYPANLQNCGGAYTIPNVLNFTVFDVWLRFVLIEDVLNLACEITSNVNGAVDLLLFRGYQPVPEGWLNEAGQPTEALTLTNVFTCTTGGGSGGCGSWEDNDLYNPLSSIYDLDYPLASISDHYIWAAKAQSRFCYCAALGSGCLGGVTSQDRRMTGRFVVGVGGTVTIGAAAPVSPCTAGSDCSTGVHDPGDCDVEAGDPDPYEPPDGETPDVPDVQVPFRAFKVCGGDGTIIGYASTTAPEGSVVSINGFNFNGEGNQCYELVGPRLLLGRDEMREANVVPLPITGTFETCTQCQVIELTQCTGLPDPPTRWMRLSDFLQYGPIFREPGGACWEGDLETSPRSAYIEGMALVEMHETHIDNLANSYEAGQCIECQQAVEQCIADPITPDVYSSAITWFGGGQSYPAGVYAIRYLEGGLKYSADQGWRAVQYKAVTSDGASTQALSGSGEYATQGELEAAFAGTQTNISHAGGKIGIYLEDDPYGDNIEGSPNPTFCLV